MRKSNLHKIFMISEELVNPEKRYEVQAWSMWMDVSKRVSSRLKLKEVNSEPLWNEMFRLRSDIEKEFGEFESEDIDGMLSDIKIHIDEHNGKWFLAYLDNECVGEIGIIPVSNNDGVQVYRLQDVDILNSHRGQGLGSDLLNSISNIALDNKVISLCLRADADDWKKDWYLRYGFQKVGEVGT